MSNTKTPSQIESELKAPFEADAIEWRIQRKGFKDGRPWAAAIAYINSRAVQERLDSVFGVFGWQNEIKKITDKGFISGISIKIGDEWITKWDGSNGSTDNGMDLIKSGSSNALKRAAVLLGIGRYLYRIEEKFVHCEVSSSYSHLFGNVYKDMKNGNKLVAWKTPDLPSWALPELNIKQYIDEIVMARTNIDLDKAYKMAVKIAKTQNNKDMMSLAKQAGATCRTKIRDNAALTLTADTKVVDLWIKDQIGTFDMVPYDTSVNSIRDSLTSALGKRTTGTLIDHEKFLKVIEDAAEKRINEINNKES